MASLGMRLSACKQKRPAWSQSLIHLLRPWSQSLISHFFVRSLNMHHQVFSDGSAGSVPYGEIYLRIFKSEAPI